MHQSIESMMSSECPRAESVAAPPLVWTGVAVTLVSCAAITAALLFAGRAERAAETAETFRRRLELLRIERELIFAADRLEALALLDLLTGARAADRGRAEVDFARQVESAEAALERFLAAGGHGKEPARRLLDALSAYPRAHREPESAAASLRAVHELFAGLDWVLLASPDGKWFELSDYVHDLQIASSYAFDTADEYLARIWERERPPVDPDLEAGLESTAAYLRALARQPFDAAATKWNLDPLLDFERARAFGPDYAELVAGLGAEPGAQAIRDAVPFLLDRTPEPPLPPEEMVGRMVHFSERLRDGAERALALADARIAAEARTEQRRRAAAHAVALLVTVAAVAALIAIESHRRRFNRHLRRLAETDALTGVGNRHSLQAIERSRLADPRQGGFALIQLDVDNFKAINDSFGHHVGDQALIAVAATCRHAVRADDSIARIGGDEFVIVLHRLAEPEAGAREVAHRIHGHLSRPLDCGGRSLRVQVSTGIATASGTADLHELMVEADLALHAAKERGVNRQEVFADPVRRALVRDLPHALSNGGIGCAFQPQFDLATGEVVGLEALARWPAAGGAAVPVGKLIDTVEWLGETRSLLRCVLTRVEAAYAETHGVFAGRFWVNLSPADLAVADAASALLGLFGAVSLPPERLGVEITESLPILDFAQASETLERLHAAGLAIAIDDFGSQNTPLKHLTRLPIDVVKLDRSVVAQIDVDRSNRVLADAVCGICAAHGMTALAEGVETEREIDALRRIGVRRAQGFAFSRPLALGGLAEFFSAGARRAAAGR
jgi:diguanylate cyclase (GGDEF)-like protein